MPRFQILARYLVKGYDLRVVRQLPLPAQHQAEAISIASDELQQALPGQEPIAVKAAPLDGGPGPEGVTTR